MKPSGEGGRELKCSFCSKPQREVKKLIAGPNVYICDECIGLCNEIIAEDQEEEDSQAITRNLLRPREIRELLDQYVVGHEYAKKILSVAVYNHYKRISPEAKTTEPELTKGNILMIGPTGAGKTYLAQTLAKILDVPFAIADATCLTEAGYVGEDVESVIQSLVRSAENDLERASRGIVYIDEIDKLARREVGMISGRDVSGEGVQQALLKILEGKKTTIPQKGDRGRPQSEFIQVDTSDILFICGGAFIDLEDIISRRLGGRAVGFGSKQDQRGDRKLIDLLVEVKPQDLQKFGLIPEFIGRLPVVAPLEDLSEEHLTEILWRPKNALVRQYQKLFEMEKVKLRFTPEAYAAISREALARKSGARGLRAILEEILLDVMYELPSLKTVRECIITESAVTGAGRPILLPERKSA